MKTLDNYVEGACGKLEYVRGFYGGRHDTGDVRMVCPSRLALEVSVQDTQSYVLVDEYFKKHWGKLSPKRREALELTRPEKISLTSYTGPLGSVCYQPNEADLAEWLSRAQNAWGSL